MASTSKTPSTSKDIKDEDIFLPADLELSLRVSPPSEDSSDTESTASPHSPPPEIIITPPSPKPRPTTRPHISITQFREPRLLSPHSRNGSYTLLGRGRDPDPEQALLLAQQQRQERRDSIIAEIGVIVVAVSFFATMIIIIVLLATNSGKKSDVG